LNNYNELFNPEANGTIMLHLASQALARLHMNLHVLACLSIQPALMHLCL
jgi:hypothetical protein